MLSYPTCFTQIYGHDEIKRRLSCMLAKRSVGHALLLTGPAGVGKSLFAWALAANLFSQECPGDEHLSKIRSGRHPDIHIYRPEGKLGLHPIGSIRHLSQEVYMPPYEASHKVFIVHEADRMSEYSANALLKTFEEPPAQTLIILITHSASALLPTIVSRCRTVRFSPLSLPPILRILEERYHLDESARKNIAIRACGSIGRALRLAEEGENPIRTRILNLLTRPPLGNYRELQEFIRSVAEEIEGVRKKNDQEAKGGAARHSHDRPSAAQQAILEKEEEGLNSLAVAQELQSLFESILSRYRDVHLLLMGGADSYLMNPDYRNALEDAAKRGDVLPLEEVVQAIQEADLAFRRSTSVAVCLETLFLKLRRSDYRS